MKKYPSQMAETYIVRMPEGMRERIREEAKRNERSMNAEIIFHLKRALFDPLEMKKGDVPA